MDIFMGIKCQNCGYERQPTDDTSTLNALPIYVCPKCQAVYAIYAKIEVTLGRKAAIAAIKAANSGSKEKYEDKKENNTSSVLHNHQETKDIVTVVIDMIKTVINWIIAQWSLWGKDLFNFIIQQSISILFIVIENVKIFINSLNKSESKEEINRQTTLSPSQEGQVGNYIDVKQAVGL